MFLVAIFVVACGMLGGLSLLFLHAPQSHETQSHETKPRRKFPLSNWK
jgi:hypothetical protein